MVMNTPSSGGHQDAVPIIKIQWQTKYFTHVRSSITMIYHLLLEQTTKTRPENKDLFLDRIIIIQCATFTLQWWFLPSFCVKSWSNLKPNDSFEICLSWGFQNTPYMLNLMNFWLRYLRLKTIDTTSKFNFISTFIASSEMDHCL